MWPFLTYDVENLISVYNNNLLQREMTIIVSMMNWGNWYKYLVYSENFIICLICVLKFGRLHHFEISVGH